MKANVSGPAILSLIDTFCTGHNVGRDGHAIMGMNPSVCVSAVCGSSLLRFKIQIFLNECKRYNRIAKMTLIKDSAS